MAIEGTSVVAILDIKVECSFLSTNMDVGVHDDIRTITRLPAALRASATIPGILRRESYVILCPRRLAANLATYITSLEPSVLKQLASLRVGRQRAWRRSLCTYSRSHVKRGEIRLAISIISHGENDD